MHIRLSFKLVEIVSRDQSLIHQLNSYARINHCVDQVSLR